MYGIQTEMSLDRKLEILSDAAKYDVACTSSGVDRRGKEGYLGNSCAAGVCHSFSADGRCVSLLKILMTNHCVYDCKYCKNRVSNDVERAIFSPEDICTLTIEFYKRNYIEGLFLSSGVLKNPDYTMEKICEALRLLRTKYKFNGYIHVKAIPGASAELIYSAGLLADRISINMELPTADSLNKLAPNKTMNNILRPMNQISGTIAAYRLAIGKDARMERAGINAHLVGSIFGPESGNEFSKISSEKKGFKSIDLSSTNFADNKGNNLIDLASYRNEGGFYYPAEKNDALLKRPFAPGGQSTQMIIGATNETDLDLIRTTQNLYKSFDLKRVFYSGYIPLNEDPALPQLGTEVPMLREHRLYQADWLLRYYGFQADELLTQEKPFFNDKIDPKCDWAIRHLETFPVEVNTASYDLLLRVPGVGPTSVKRIMSARRYSKINFQMLKKMGVVLKRAQFFLTCNGKMLFNTPIEEQFIMSQLCDNERKENVKVLNDNSNQVQMNLFSDFNMKVGIG